MFNTKERILFVHNAYQHRGGEDSVVDDEIRLLQDNGHEVKLFSLHNDTIHQMGKAKLLANTIWSTDASALIERELKQFKPDVVHVHNTFPLISPSIYWACSKHGIPVVQTLHNFRTVCPQAMLLRDGAICEDCLGKLPWRAVTRSCYRNSTAHSAVLAGMITTHRWLGTWNKKVSAYIALNTFSREKFIQAGLPAEKIHVKPNFVDHARPETKPRSGFLFVGRLSPEKGIDVLTQCAQSTPEAQYDVAGTGPEQHKLDGHANITQLGSLSAAEVRERMTTASCLLLPSICYENFPRTIVEAMAAELPVIASNLGAMATLIDDGKTGLLFKPGDANDMAEKIRWATENIEQLKAMGKIARKTYEEKYTAHANYTQIKEIYESITQPSKINQN